MDNDNSITLTTNLLLAHAIYTMDTTVNDFCFYLFIFPSLFISSALFFLTLLSPHTHNDLIIYHMHAFSLFLFCFLHPSIAPTNKISFTTDKED